MTCLTILGAAHSAAKTKKLEAEEVLDNVARHQSVLEEELREHRAEIKASDPERRRSVLPDYARS